jgi:integrase
MAPGGVQFVRGKRITDTGRTAPGMLHPLAALPLKDLDRAAVARWVQEANLRGKTEAAKHFRLLRAFLRWCAESEQFSKATHQDACDGRTVRDHVKRPTAKDDCLQREQLPLWFEHVRKLPNPVQSAYLQALLLTGARPGELVGIQWEEVDFQWKALTIRDKVEGERTIPLTPYVAALLAALPRRNGWVFSSPTAADGRLVEPRYAHHKALTAGGLPALTLHGLRRSFGTLAEWVECPAGIAAQIMGHKPSATAEKHYRVRPLDLLRMWHSKIEAWILEQAGIEQPKGETQGLKVVV